MFQFAELLIFGTVQGAVLALLALGFSLVYGVGGVLNLAHGGFYLLTCYILYVSLLFFDLGLGLLDLTVSIVISIVVISIVGAVSYLILIKPLQDSNIGVVIVTFSFAFFLEQLVKIMVDTKTHTIPVFSTILNFPGSVEFIGVTFSSQFVISILGSLILVAVVGLFISKTKIGKSIRAVAQDREAAMLMGINANRVLMVTVALSAFLAGMAAVLYGPANAIAPHIGWSFLISAFAVTVFGGMGSISGSIIGAFIMGYAKVAFSYFIPVYGTTFATIFPLIVIVIMLLVRPQGLLGKKEVR